MSRPALQDRPKVHEKARRLSLKRDAGKAISTLVEHIAGDPSDDRALLILAELRRRAGDDAGAAAAFQAAAELYAARGFALRAAACLRQARALLPGDVALQERLAEMNLQLGLPREAARILADAAAAASALGDRARHVEIRRRIHELLPGDADAAIRLADLLAEDGRTAESIALLERAAGSLAGPAHEASWILIQERLCALEPANLARAGEVARRLVSRGTPKRALALLEPCLAATPDDLDALRLLARASSAAGLLPEAADALRRIARVHEDAGRDAEAREAREEARALLPDDPEPAQALPPPREPSLPDGLADELAEADFLADQGLTAEALEILHRLREAFPGTKEIADRIEELDVEIIETDELIVEEEPDGRGAEAPR